MTQSLYLILHQKPPKETETTAAKDSTCQVIKPLGAGAEKGFPALMGCPSPPKQLARLTELVIPAWQN